MNETALPPPSFTTASNFAVDDHEPTAARPLRIWHLGKYYPPATGGFEFHVQTLARGQVAQGQDVSVLCVNHLDPQGHDVTWKSFRQTRLQIDQDGPVRVERLARWGCVARCEICPQLLSTLRRLNRPEVDILHLHNPNPPMLLALAAMRVRPKLVVSHHSDIVRQRILGKALNWFEHRVYRQAAQIIVTSPPYFDGSAVLQPYRDRVAVVPHGIDLQPFLQLSSAAQAAADRWRQVPGPRWLFVGRLVYYKGLEHALAALVHVPGTLIVVGRGPLAKPMQDLAVKLGVADRVQWHDYLSGDELAGAYHSATALWFPSNARSEAFGLVQVEAMASACPVINAAIPHSGVAWVSLHDQTGLTIPLNDPAALAAAAQRLLDEPGLRDRLGTEARARAESEFDSRTMARRTVQVYRRALVGTRSAVEVGS